MHHINARPVSSGGLFLALALLGLSACNQGGRIDAQHAQLAEACAADGSFGFEAKGIVNPGDEKQYRLIAIDVPPGANGIEFGYGWSDRLDPLSTPLTQTVLDLGAWDADGYRNPAGFRGWSGSRQGKLHEGQPPIFITAGGADRGYLPGPIEPGTWHIELGFAAVGPAGADWYVEGRIHCDAISIPRPPPDPVDPEHVANPSPGWYRGDFHMHGFHSNPNGPAPAEVVGQARDAGLDFLMITEYVTGRHWQEWGQTQRDNPDLLIWPGREIITYFGHANALGETPSVLEYRHGFEDVRLADIQRMSKADGALFQVNHPTTFPGPLFENFCRGCEFTLGDEIDWSLVDTMEVVSGPIITTAGDLGLPLPGQIQNPFTRPALNLWDDLLLRGYRISAVSGSDFKGVEQDPSERLRSGYGSSATVVYASELSRAAITEALRQGRSYIQTRGMHDSPELEFSAVDAHGQEVMFGGTLNSSSATLRTRVINGQGQTLRYLVDGRLSSTVRITSNDFTHELEVSQAPTQGPLGTYWRVETRDFQSLTTIGSPIFLKTVD